jgi:hypothetical protein
MNEMINQKNAVWRTLLFLCIITSFVGCMKNNVTLVDYCGQLTGKTVEKELGRVYYLNNSGMQIYYIGNPDSLFWNGGVVACNKVLDTYVSAGNVGDLVIYSGEFREPNTLTEENDPIEPLYGGIELSFIERFK